MRTSALTLFVAMACGLLVSMLGIDAAYARMGGGSGFMDSPGYQRRLQESRGQVTNQSGSLASPAQPYTQPPAVYPRRPAGQQQKRRR